MAATLSEKLDANMIEKFVYLPKLMGMKVIEKSGGIIVDTNIPCDMFNVVCSPKSALDVESVYNYFSSRNLPFAFWTGFNNEYSDFQKDIEKIGLSYDETETGMAVSVNELDRKSDFGISCDKLEIKFVSSAELLRDFIAVYKNLIPNDASAIDEFYTKAAPFVLNPSSALKLFVGFYEEMSVATSALFL